MLVEPSKEQQEIILSDKNTIVTSNPGTGKTTTLSLKVLKLLEDDVKPENILCITFTEKAKAEMFDKIFQMANGKFSDTEIMKLNIHTFHGFAYNYLLESGIISGDIVGNNFLRYSILNSFEQNKALTYSKDYIISTIVPKTENAIRYIKSYGITPDKIDVSKATMLIKQMYDSLSTSYSLEELQAFLGYFVKAFEDYENSKENKIDYSDMLLLFISNFKEKKFEYVLVDEMQDMNELEARIAEIVGDTIFLVGDAKQAIFGFQGGSIKNFQKFKEMCDSKILSSNRRSSQQILDYSKGFFLGKTQSKELFRRELDLFKSDMTGIKPKVISTRAPLCRILNIIDENPDKSIGVITRTNRQIIEISQYLDTCNVKYSSTSSQATTEQAKTEILNYLKGMISDRIEDKIAATFTIFSPYTLKEAFEISEAHKSRNAVKLEKIRSWGFTLKKSDVDRLFSDTIFPLCVSKGAEWFSTGIIIKQQIEEYLATSIPTIQGLFDFISITEESYMERISGSKITLTTVHKAKGRDFDVVIYLPSQSTARTSFVDVIVKSILKSSGLDTKEELEEESIRIDFVAFTRAKEKLYVITDDAISKNYQLDSLSEIEMDERQDEMIATKLNSRLAEAFSLFIAGRFKDSEKLLKAEDGWLEEFIKNYFKEIKKFSYSSITTNPYEFLVRNIIAMPAYYEATDFGSKVHKALAKVTTGKSTVDEFDGDVKRAVENGLEAISALKAEFPGLKLVGAEEGYDLPLSSMIDYNDQNLIFKGFMDAVFEHDNGYIIVDYKTDKDDKRASEHKRQLAVYRKMYSAIKSIPENKINIFVVFVALRGGINTGRFAWSVEKENRNAYPTFVKHLKTVLEWRDDPQKFIKELLENPSDEMLYQVIKEKLQTGTEEHSL